MRTVIFYIFYLIIRIITLMPLRILYILSDFLFLLLYYFPSYRRDVVAANLKNAFPEKSVTELKNIEKKFYKHLADLFVEILKMTNMSKHQHMKRFVISNPEVLNKLHDEKRDTIAVLGHYCNWEWMSVLPEYTKYHVLAIYKPLQNKFFNDLVYGFRSKFGVGIIPMSLIIREIITNIKYKTNTLSLVLSDQTPVKHDIRYWTTFMNQETPVYTGIEKIASKYDMAVVFFNYQKIKRGYYNLKIELLFEHTAGLEDNIITETHVKRLEQMIREKPEYWLWSHRRWKHKRPVEND